MGTAMCLLPSTESPAFTGVAASSTASRAEVRLVTGWSCSPTRTKRSPRCEERMRASPGSGFGLKSAKAPAPKATRPTALSPNAMARRSLPSGSWIIRTSPSKSPNSARRTRNLCPDTWAFVAGAIPLRCLTSSRGVVILLAMSSVLMRIGN
ncbi:hypothetical protein CPTD_00585 [Corynebacterium pseudotuberculosis]|nr:hypothetical protein CPTD_00585 [Corynebacterium pseudotuberculosis]